jgi:hypothetical protein
MIIKIISDAKIHVNTSPFTHETEAGMLLCYLRRKLGIKSIDAMKQGAM